MKRENFLLVTVTGCSGLDKKGVYRVGMKLGDKEKMVKWSKRSNSPEWFSGVYFPCTYEAAGSRKKGLCFKLYKRGLFGFKSLVAKHEFDPGRITFYGVYNDWIDLMTTGKKPTLYCRLKVRVQYVRSTDYFTCPSCPRLDNHEPIVFMGNIENITLNKLIKKKTSVTLSCGKFKESTEQSDNCTFNHHFMVDPTLLTKKKVTVSLYKKKKCMGTCTIDKDTLEEGNWCDLKLTVKKGKKEVGTVKLLLQMVYECSDCIVEREDEDGDVDIPVKPVERPAVQPTASYSIEGVIPGMSTIPAQPQPARPTQPVQPVQPVQPQPAVAFPQVMVQPEMIPVAIPMNQPYVPVATPYSAPSASNNVYVSIPGMSGY